MRSLGGTILTAIRYGVLLALSVLLHGCRSSVHVFLHNFVYVILSRGIFHVWLWLADKFLRYPLWTKFNVDEQVNSGGANKRPSKMNGFYAKCKSTQVQPNLKIRMQQDTFQKFYSWGCLHEQDTFKIKFMGQQISLVDKAKVSNSGGIKNHQHFLPIRHSDSLIWVEINSPPCQVPCPVTGMPVSCGLWHAFPIIKKREFWFWFLSVILQLINPSMSELMA